MPDDLKQERVYKDSSQTRTPDTNLFAVDWRRKHRKPVSQLAASYSAGSNITRQQIIAGLLLLAATGFCAVLYPNVAAAVIYWLIWGLFMGNAVVRLLASLIPPGKADPSAMQASNDDLPTYSVIVALYKEADIVPQLLNAMQGLNYPRDRLEILFALEADDHDTIAAFHARTLPAHMHIVEVPEGLPRTKPRALNHALGQAHGELCVIYDAEDQPHPDQLLAAAYAFASGDPHLACVQAPLRPVGGDTFIGRQFAAEYAVQFDVLLPALTRLGLPFPLGGTSNHFKVEVLKGLGAWDAWNVTEDADLGLRLAQYGYRSGLIAPPTHEAPPALSRTWIPQRTRWIKGYLQTCLVHTRLNTRFRLRVWLGLFLGVGLSAGAALCYAPFCAMVLMSLLTAALQNLSSPYYPAPPLSLSDLSLFAIGSLSAIASLIIGARRAGLRLGAIDLLCAPFYWCLQSIAAGFALYQLAVKPFHWDKTEHTPTAHNPLADAPTSAYGESHENLGHTDAAAHRSLG